MNQLHYNVTKSEHDYYLQFAEPRTFNYFIYVQFDGVRIYSYYGQEFQDGLFYSWAMFRYWLQNLKYDRFETVIHVHNMMREEDAIEKMQTLKNAIYSD